jgi:hypothetical protein
MNKVLVVVILVISAAFLAAERSQNVRAALESPISRVEQTPREGKGCVAPKSWGELKGISDRAVAFQDSSGSIRVLDTGPCMRGETQLIVKITRE